MQTPRFLLFLCTMHLTHITSHYTGATSPTGDAHIGDIHGLLLPPFHLPCPPPSTSCQALEEVLDGGLTLFPGVRLS